MVKVGLIVRLEVTPGNEAAVRGPVQGVATGY